MNLRQKMKTAKRRYHTTGSRRAVVDDALSLVVKLYAVADIDRDNYKEAAEFETLVAKHLAKRNLFSDNCNSSCYWSRMDPQDPHYCFFERRHGKQFCSLRAARCAVEEDLHA